MATSSRAVTEARMVMCSTGSEDPGVSGDSTACNMMKHHHVLYEGKSPHLWMAFHLFEALP